MMKNLAVVAAFTAGANALVPRASTCCFGLTASGSASGTVGQLSDGQNRIGGGLPPSQFCIDSSGGITDGNGRGCILTGPTTQFQCDSGASPMNGFSITSSGTVEYNGSSHFIACETGDNGELNIYTTSSDAVTGCKDITLMADSCKSGNASTSPALTTSASPQPSSASPQPSSAASQPSGAASPPSGAAPPPPGAVSQPSGAPLPPGAVSQPSGAASPPSGAVSPPSGAASQASGAALPPGAVSPPSGAASPPSGAASQASGAASLGSSPGSCSAPAQESSAPGASQSAPGPESSGPAASQSSPAPESSAPAPAPESSAPAHSSAPAPESSAPAASKPASETATPTTSQPSASQPASSGGCGATLSGNYESPHLIIPIDSSAPSKAEGTSFNGTITSTVSSIFNFDVPSSDSGKQCSLVFLFPKKEDLETSSFSFSGDGKLDFSSLSSVATQSTSYSNAPAVKSDLGTFTVSPGNSYTISTFSCPAGQTVSYKISNAGSTDLNYFQDYNPSPIGLYITVC